MTLPDLIKRLEAAEGASEELDRDICVAAGHQVKFGEFHKRWLMCDTADGNGWIFVPSYTASIDAALTLVPEGMDWEILRLETDGPKRAECFVYPKPYMLCGDGNYGESKDERHYGQSPISAIALTIACLKARLP